MSRIHDAFLSYSSEDEEVATRLHQALTAHGVDVWFAPEDVQKGSRFVEKLEQGLDSSRAFILLVSQSAIESGWVQEEYSRALGLAQREQAFPVIPVLLDVAPPGFLQNRSWVDLRGGSLEEKIRELLGALPRQFDVFLAIQDAYQGFDEAIVKALEARKLQVWTAERQIVAGDDEKKAYLKGLRESRAVALVITPATEAEWVTDCLGAVKKVTDAGFTPPKIIPVIVETAAAPAEIENLKTLVLKTVDQAESAVEEMVQACAKARRQREVTAPATHKKRPEPPGWGHRLKQKMTLAAAVVLVVVLMVIFGPGVAKKPPELHAISPQQIIEGSIAEYTLKGKHLDPRATIEIDIEGAFIGAGPDHEQEGKVLTLSGGKAIRAHIRVGRHSDSQQAVLTVTNPNGDDASLVVPIRHYPHEDEINALVASMDIDELIGQTIMAGFDAGTLSVAPSNQGLKRLISDYKIGNLILFKWNFPRATDSEDVAKYLVELTKGLQSTAFASQRGGRRIPLLIAVDQEGGSFSQIDRRSTQVPGHMFLGSTKSKSMARLAGRIIGEEMRFLGFNTVLAPVADVNSNLLNDLVGVRAFGAHREVVTPLAAAFSRGLQEGGVLSFAKHFPGHGDAVQDPHFVLPVISSEETIDLENNDLHPFRGLIKEGVNGLLTAHLLATPLDGGAMVTFNPKIVKGKLREQLDFDGVILTDDMFMRAVLLDPINRETRSLPEAVLKAYEAGHDMVMLGQLSPATDLEAILDKIRAYFQDETRQGDLRDRVARIVRQKVEIYGIEAFSSLERWLQEWRQEDYEKMLGENRRAAEEMAADSTVLVVERGKIINDLDDSALFRRGSGPLSPGKLLDPGDKLLLVSPVYRQDDLKEEIIERGWIPRQDVVSLHLVYGWKNAESASTYWDEPVQRLFRIRRETGEVEFYSTAIERKVEEILHHARGKRAMIFGIVTRGQAEVLNRLVARLQPENSPLEIVVLLFKEPYLLPKKVSQQKNVTALSASPFPSTSAVVKALFGDLLPKPSGYLSSSTARINRNEHPGVQVN